MAINFPSSLDTFTNPAASDLMASGPVPHHAQHGNLNDIAMALETKVGANSSTDKSSIDFKIGSGAVNVRWSPYGAVGNGATDDRAAIVAAIAAAYGDGNNPKSVYFPPGAYYINTDGGTINVPEGMCLYTDAGFQVQPPGTFKQGATFWIKGATNSPFTLNRGCHIRGLGFYYVDQPINTSTPTVFPPCFTDGGAGCSKSQFTDLYFINCYIGFKFGDVATNKPGGAVFMRGVKGCFFNRFMVWGNVLAESTFSQCVISALFVPGPSTNTQAYQGANLVVFDVDGENDGMTVEGMLCFRGKSFINRTQSTGASQSLNFWRINHVMCDGFQSGYTTDGVGEILSMQFSNCYFRLQDIEDASISPTGFDFTFNGASGTTNKVVQFHGCRFRAANGRVINVGPGTTHGLDRLIIDSCQFYDWGTGSSSATGVEAIKVDNTNVSVHISGCDFDAVTSAASPRAVYLNGFKYAHVTDNNVIGADTGFLFGNGTVLHFSRNTTVNCVTIGADTVGVTPATIPSVVWSHNQLDRGPAIQRGTRPAFCAHITGVVTFNSVSAVTVSMDTEEYDRGSNYDQPSYTFTAPIAGVYEFSFAMSHDNAPTVNDQWQIDIVTVQKTFKYVYTVKSLQNQSISMSCVANMSRGDTCKLQITRAAGSGNFTTVSSAAQNWFCGRLVE